MLAFVISVAMGFATPFLEKPVAQPIASWLRGFFPVEDREVPAIAFMVSVLGAGIIAAVLGSDAVLGVTLGVVLGYFAARLFALIKKVIENRPE